MGEAIGLLSSEKSKNKMTAGISMRYNHEQRSEKLCGQIQRNKKLMN